MGQVWALQRSSARFEQQTVLKEIWSREVSSSSLARFGIKDKLRSYAFDPGETLDVPLANGDDLVLNVANYAGTTHGHTRAGCVDFLGESWSSLGVCVLTFLAGY
ncbi:hypothetical protein vseg_011688 [Gypsophila vaccaria]